MESPEPKSFKEDKKASISYGQLALIIIVFILGIISALLYLRGVSTDVTSFSTIELIGFLFSIAISSSSIVLAIVAIILGKSSELSMIRRSDESIKLQNDVFIKTIEALEGIKSSTNVTEKRIDDLNTVLVKEIKERLIDSPSGRGVRNDANFEAKIRDSVQAALSNRTDSDTKVNRQEKLERKKKKSEEYENNHKKLMLGIGNIDDVKIVKTGHGYPSDMKEDIEKGYDWIFKTKTKVIGVSTIGPGFAEEHSNSTFEFAGPLDTGEVDMVLLIFFYEGTDEKTNPSQEASESLKLLSEGIQKKMFIFDINYDKVDDWLKEEPVLENFKS